MIFVSPFFTKASSIVYTVLSSLCIVFMMFFVFLGLRKETEEYKESLEYKLEKIRKELRIEQEMQEEEKDKPSKNNRGRNDKSNENESLIDNGSDDENESHEFDGKLTLQEFENLPEKEKFKLIHPCVRFWKHFKLPSALEWIEIVSIFLFFVVQILKSTHQALYDNIKYVPEQFLDIGQLEEFQYAILSIDYVFIILLSLTLMRYLSKYIDVANKTEKMLINFVK